MATLDFFRDPSIQEHGFFDEGTPAPKVKPRITSNTGSVMVTTAIDGWRQGVEITQQKHYDAGTAKIWAGESGHMPKQNRFGMGEGFITPPPFHELDYFNPVTFIRLQDGSSDHAYTYPIVTGDNNENENYTFDGIIEPLTIRALAAFFSIDVPVESHDTKGALMDGNTDNTNASDRVLTVDRFSMTQNKSYVDLIDMFGNRPLNGFFHVEKSPLGPFVDGRLRFELDYITGDQRSSTSGWVYDGVEGIGTDSLAFGGQTY